ncbi:MAG TPA: hypothetical protein VFV72_00480 [Candidatus Limnocylindrales bacterium]|nr:hypothetical protein [Candidatus Limnocylindrales bacterium]
MDTFVLRIWAPASGAGEATGLPIGTHGTAHHVISGRSGVFRSEEQLIRLLDELRREALADGEARTGTTPSRNVAA